MEEDKLPDELPESEVRHFIVKNKNEQKNVAVVNPGLAMSMHNWHHCAASQGILKPVTNEILVVDDKGLTSLWEVTWEPVLKMKSS